MSDSFVLFRPFCRAAGAGGRERERGKRKAEGPAGEREQKTKRMCKEKEGTRAWALKLNSILQEEPCVFREVDRDQVHLSHVQLSMIHQQ